MESATLAPSPESTPVRRALKHRAAVNSFDAKIYIDDIRSANPDDIAKAKNYVRMALDELLAGKEVSVRTSQPYGCSVKYK